MEYVKIHRHLCSKEQILIFKSIKMLEIRYIQVIWRWNLVAECWREWSVGQPESKLSGQLRCTTLLPASSNFLKPNIPSPKIGLLIGNYEGCFIYFMWEYSTYIKYLRRYPGLADMLSDIFMRWTLAMSMRMTLWVTVISTEVSSWDVSMTGNFQIPINNLHYDKMYQSG